MSGHAPRPLEGRRIVITRAPEQAEELISRLTALGAEVLSLPMVRFVEPLDSAGLDLAIAGIEHFDWILFTSANAVRFFLARCRALDFPFESTESDVRPRIAVVGPATRDALELQGLGAKGEPKEFSGTGLIAALADAVGQMSDADSEYVLNVSLGVVTRQQAGGTGWAKIRASNGAPGRRSRSPARAG